MKILKTFEAFSCSEDSKCIETEKIKEVEDEKDEEATDLETLNKDSDIRQNIIDSK